MNPVASPVSSTERLTVLANAARAMHGASDRDRLLAWAAAAIRNATHAEGGALCLLDPDGSPTWTVAPGSRPDFSQLGDPRSNALFAPVLSLARQIELSGLDESSDDAYTQASLGTASLLVLPIPSSGELPLGAVFLGHSAPGAFTPDDRAAGVALASHLGVALENLARQTRLAELEAEAREVVHRLQDAVRPPIPVVDATELGFYYRAADQNAQTGGDLYDWVTLPDGDLHFAVVDVMGKGVAATKDALAVTHALRLLAFDGCPLENLVTRADALVCAQNPDLVATLMVGRYTPSTGWLRLVGGGHPPALVVRGDEVEEVAAPGIPIGWPGAASHGVAELHLDRSDTVVLYTDGLIEATKDILQGLQALRGAAEATRSYPARGMARALVDRALEGAARHDDSLALVLRRRTPPLAGSTHRLAPFEHRFSPNTANVGIARHLFREWLERIPVAENDLHDALLIAAELCSNAVRHATGEPGGVVLRSIPEGDSLSIEVEDDGGALTSAPRSDDIPDVEAERGRGLFLVSSLSDELTSEVRDGRTVVRALRRGMLPAAVHAGSNA